MELKLKRKDYEYNRDLYQLQYIKWDADKKNYVKTDSRDYKLEIYKIEELKNSKITELKNVLKNWLEEICNIDIKDYGTARGTKALHKYKSIQEDIVIDYLDIQKLKKDYPSNRGFCCAIRNKDEYLNIAIFFTGKSEDIYSAELAASLAYPASQTMKEKRKDGTFGACGHNARVAMINFIFSHKHINSIYSYAINEEAQKALIKLKFTEYKEYK